jgi:hypothetical protein
MLIGANILIYAHVTSFARVRNGLIDNCPVSLP